MRRRLLLNKEYGGGTLFVQPTGGRVISKLAHKGVEKFDATFQLKMLPILSLSLLIISTDLEMRGIWFESSFSRGKFTNCFANFQWELNCSAVVIYIIWLLLSDDLENSYQFSGKNNFFHLFLYRY